MNPQIRANLLRLTDDLKNLSDWIYQARTHESYEKFDHVQIRISLDKLKESYDRIDKIVSAGQVTSSGQAANSSE